MKNCVSILAFDLGNNLGWAQINCSLKPQIKVAVPDHGTIYLDSLTNERLKKEYNEIYSRSRVKLLAFEETIRKIIENANVPDAIVVEDIFCMPNRVSAFRALTLYMETLERIVNLEYKKRLVCVPTKICKMMTANSGSADKDDVQAAILSNPAITVKKPEKLSQHSSDAIAVAYSFILNHLNF